MELDSYGETETRNVNTKRKRDMERNGWGGGEVTLSGRIKKQLWQAVKEIGAKMSEWKWLGP